MNAWQRSRITSSFESKETARKRKSINDENQNPTKKTKDHTGNYNSMIGDKEELRREVEELPNDFEINYSHLARKYNVCDSSGKIASNGGQIVKEYLMSEGVELSRFKLYRKDDKCEVIRRRKRKGKGGEISIPTEISTKKLKQKLKENIESGKYTVGEFIVPCTVSLNTFAY